MGRRFRTKVEGLQASSGAYLCLKCREVRPKKLCGCGAAAEQVLYFPSRLERQRAAALRVRQDRGTIDRLKFHPRYDLHVNGHKIGVYEADSIYRQNGAFVVEDCKPPKWMTDLAKWKIRHFNAEYGHLGLKVSLHH